jgi:1-acyl-sn-glycerol-3-phosphate acyltransferase
MKQLFLYLLVKVFLGAALSAYFRLHHVRVYGKENIPFGRPAIFYANHPSNLDPFLILVLGFWPKIIWRPDCLPWPLAAEEVMKRFKLGWLLDYVCVSVRRGSGSAGAIRQAVKKLREGKSVLIFPEGRRTGQEEIMEIQGGIKLISRFCREAPLVPIIVNGTSRVLPPKKKWPCWRNSSVSVSFGRRFLVNLTEQPEECQPAILREILAGFAG